MSVSKDCPCKKDNGDCTKRHVNCHSYCPEYKDWRAELDKENEAKKDESDYIAYRKNTIWKRIKRKNEKRNFRR